MSLRDLVTNEACAPSGGETRNPVGNFFNNLLSQQEKTLEVSKISEGEFLNPTEREREQEQEEIHRALENEARFLHELDHVPENMFLSPEVDNALLGGEDEVSVNGINWNDSFWEQFHQGFHPPPSLPQQYEFRPENTFLTVENPFETAVELFQKGRLADSILAFEAHLQRHPHDGNESDVWRWLGTAQAENDNDKLAILCLKNSVQADPENLEALLDIGVSYTNELAKTEALDYLKSWLRQHPEYQVLSGDIDRTEPQLNAGIHIHQEQVINLFLKAVEINPDDVDLYTVLGVLYNLTREYDKAERCFELGTKLDPNSYSLWNKLGATKANSPKVTGSKEAIQCYRKALELKPNYVRSWVNMGISYANQNQYDLSAKYYLKALSLNPDADHIWSYLRIAFSCMEREDLIDQISIRDINVFRKYFKF